MSRRAQPWPLSIGAAILAVAAQVGCSSVPDATPGIVVDGNRYITLPAPLGSHIKRRIKVIDLNEPPLAPSKRYIVTPDTEPILLPPPPPPHQTSGL